MKTGFFHLRYDNPSTPTQNKLKKRGFNQVEKIFKPWIDKHHFHIAIFLSVQTN